MNLFQNFLTNNDCYNDGRIIEVKGVMVHDTGAENRYIKRYVQPDINGIGKNINNNDWNRPGVMKCVHAFIGALDDGTIATCQTLPFNKRGWHAGGYANNTHVGFEICRDINDPIYFEKVYKEAVEFTAHLCKEFNLDPLKTGTIICHHEGYEMGWASNHADVTEWFPIYGKDMDMFRADVKQEMEVVSMDLETFKEYYNKMVEEWRDNDAGTWSSEARQWAVDNGLVAGGDALPDGSPNYMWEDNLTREQFVVILYRMHLNRWF